VPVPVRNSLQAFYGLAGMRASLSEQTNLISVACFPILTEGAPFRTHRPYRVTFSKRMSSTTCLASAPTHRWLQEPVPGCCRLLTHF